jgi:hypothetical protein
MESFALEVYVREVVTQCKFAQMAMVDLRNTLNRKPVDVTRVFYSVHVFLMFVANLSKLLFPGKKDEDRGAELRRTLNVPLNSPIRAREFRNHYEHYDTRLDRWARSRPTLMIDMNVLSGPISSVTGVPHRSFMRNFDSLNYNLSFHGETYGLLNTEVATNRILKEAKSFLKMAKAKG